MMTARQITSYDDIIDSREIIERLDELAETEDRDETEDRELATLRAFVDEYAGDIEDWQYGATLIRDSYFIEYAQELADDIGAIDTNASWPLTHIDWEGAARDLRMDYTPVEFDGVTYWVR